MIVVLGADHAGYKLKNKIKEYLKTTPNISIVDLGTNSDESVDYPEYGKAAAKAVASGKADRGIVVCGTGIGISIAANKVSKIRCALCTSKEMAEMSRRHNDANMLALGGRTTSEELAFEIVKTWLNTDFEGGRHEKRVKMLDEDC